MTLDVSEVVQHWLQSSHIDQIYVNGKWIEPTAKEKIEVKNPATNEVIAKVAAANKLDAQQAVKAAREAFNQSGWADSAATYRAKLLLQLADEIESDAAFLAHVETMNNGKLYKDALGDVRGTAATFRYYAAIIQKPSGEVLNVEKPFTAKVVREPIGVCGLIVPWNYPLLMAAWKLAPALAAGNACILKPSELTPLTSIRLFELIDKVGFPAGVVNLLQGTGQDAGEALVVSEQVDKIAFTGGTKTGKHIMKQSVSNLKKVTLELGGKSANIVFADADYETALDHALFAIFGNAGEVCSAGSRLLVERSIYDQFVEDLVKKAKALRVGNGFDKRSQMGPLVSEAQLEKIKYYIEIGKQEATLACGGNVYEDDLRKHGNYIEPTIFIDVDPHARIAQEEIFGPVLAVIPFETEEAAIQIANDTKYGLAGAVFTNDVARAERVTSRLRVGITWVNTYEEGFIEGPWGGYKQSGIGRELGTYGLDAYQEVKQMVNMSEIAPTGWLDS